MGVESVQEVIAGHPAVRAFCDLIDGVPQVMGAVKDAAGRYVYVNSGFADRVGAPVASIIGTKAADHFAPELASSYEEQDQHVITKGTPLRHHLELIVRSDGHLGWYVTSKTALVDESGTRVGLIVMSIDLQAQVNSPHAGLAMVIERIRDDISHPWRVRELAEIAGLSSSQLERLCRRTLGISPQRLLQRIRLEHAVRLIVHSDAPLGRIAAECGFYDQASFTRQFRSVLGLTPGSYRRGRSLGSGRLATR